MKKIGFIFFDSLHIIHHFIGSAVALNKEADISVDILTYEGNHTYLFELLTLLEAPNNILKKLPTYRYRKIIDLITNRKHPSSKYLFEKHKNKLLNYDVLVFNDANHEYLHDNKRGDKPKFAMLMHGAGDREYLLSDRFIKKLSKFDLITTPGNKVNSFYKKMKLPHTKLDICGYQKFDLVKIENKDIHFFNNDKPIVLYNPHFQEGLSSWYKYGNAILDFFYNNNDYNLIFAPHINLYNQKGFIKQFPINAKYNQSDNIHIDLGSFSSVNMSYTMAASIYLGDVSSQIYEFLMNQKPCIFINAYLVSWDNNVHYKNWKLGKVINNISKLNEVLDSANQWQEQFTELQKQAMNDTFYTTAKFTATQCVVNSIKKIC